ncbi:MAG: peptide MFS transporter [Elusimicrobiota bacterium]|jgi:POT family proton-dependent oligopeptide transporter|nr:peptide MFS transporter [Elusimicrobiota bacterium]
MDAASELARQEELIKRGHPKGLYMLFMVEMWERFNYYGMRALLVLFMISSVIGFEKTTAYKIYGWYTALVYLTPVFGGYLADRFIGKRHSITIGAILMAMGQFTLASYGFIPAKIALFGGLALVIIGNGFFKPNISSIVGDLYETNDPRRDSGFTIFYMGINVGAFIAPFITGFVGEQTRAGAASWVQWRWGFMVAGIGMIIGLIWYLLSQKRYLGDVGLHPVSKGITAEEKKENHPLTNDEKDRILAIFTFTFIAVFFFAFFEQAGSSLSVFAQESIDRVITIFGKTWEVPASWFQSINPIAVVILAPLFAKLWIKLAKQDKEPSIPVKFGWGIFLTGAAFLVLAIGSLFLADGPINMLWLIGLFILCTCGELCLSPVGLSMVTKLSPAKLMSFFMGIWLTASFLGNLIAGYFAGLSESLSKPMFFAVPAGILIVFSLIVWGFSKKIKSWMHGVN